MQRVINRFIVVASVVAVAAGSAACARQDGSDSASSILSPTALEARGGGGGKGGGGTTTGGSGSLSLAMVIDNNSDGLPSFGDTVTFNVQTSATAYPWVTLRCKQNGTLVSQESNGIFATSLDQNFTLGPTSLWPGGTADCTATLENWDSYSKNGSITVLGSTSFPVN